LRNKIYSAQMTRKTYKKLLEEGFAAISACSRGRRPRPPKLHNGVILDATFSRRSLRKFLRDEFKKAKVPFQFVELDVDPNEIKKRLKRRDEKTAEASDARLEDFEKLITTYETPYELEPGLVRVSTTRSVSDTVKTILLCLAEKQSFVAKKTPSAESR
jgi:predicted kinase